jgi:hypothetical protein
MPDLHDIALGTGAALELRDKEANALRLRAGDHDWPRT